MSHASSRIEIPFVVPDILRFSMAVRDLSDVPLLELLFGFGGSRCVVKEWKFQFLLAKLVFIRFVSLLYRVVSISKRLKIVNNSRFFFFSWIWPCHSIDFDPISAWRFNGATFSIDFDSRDQLLLETFRFWRSTSPFLRGSLFPRTYVFHPCIYSGRICKGRWDHNLQQYRIMCSASRF